MDDILESKERIKYEEVFDTFGSGELVLIEGRPGGGKTTLVNKVARDWARGGDVLNNAKLVYLITLRYLDPKKDGNLSDVLELFYSNREKREKVLDGIEKTEGEGVCFIIDGLDEYQPQDESKSVIYRVLHKNCLHMAMVIVASRPVATATLRGLATRRIEVLGFTQEQIFEYIDKFPFSSDISDTFRDKLRQYLHSHLNILHICYLPVHTAMICFLYQEKEGDIPSTQTNIYEEFTKCIILRKQKRKNNKAKIDSLVVDLKEDEMYFKDLCHLAYDMTIKNKQTACGKEIYFLEHTDFNDLSSLGLVTFDCTAKLSGHYKTYSFLHLTFQEYLAAWYIAHLDDKKEQMEIIRLYTKKGYMLMVWKFYCGMVEFEGQISQIEQIMPVKSINNQFILHAVHCAFESQQTAVCNHLIKSTNLISTGLINDILTPADLTALGHVISIASHRVRNIQILNSSVTDDHLKALIMVISIDKLKNLETWNTVMVVLVQMESEF